MWKKLKKDISDIDYNNKDEKKVLKAHFISAYRKTFVLKVPFTSSGLSIGIIFLGAKVKDSSLVRHEYGHRLLYGNDVIRNVEEARKYLEESYELGNARAEMHLSNLV